MSPSNQHHNVETPIVFFVFNRADVTARVLDALRQQSVLPPRLIVYADAARHDGEKADVEAVARLLHAIDWIPTELNFRPQNYGGASNIIQGVSEVLAQYERAIVLEDDVLPAIHFYEALCLLLDTYAGEESVFSVGAYPYLRSDALPDYPYDVIMCARFNILGWGIWADRWQRVQAQLYDFRQPFPSLADVPTTAGLDLPEFARQAEENTRPFFWTGTGLMLLSAYYGWRHALTRSYLVFNIGRGAGQNVSGFPMPNTIQYFAEHNILQDRLPQRLAPAIADAAVDEAVQEYIRGVYDMMRLDGKNAAARRHPFWARVRRKLSLELSRLFSATST